MSLVHLVLASASPARLATLRAAGIDPTVIVSDVDEEAAVAAAEALHGPLAASDVALLLARAKAEDVCRGGGPAAYQPCVVLGCDSVLELDGEVHGKPGDDAEAIARWRRMRGRTGTLHTGHWLVDERESSHGGTGGMVGGTASTVVHFADLDDAEIEAYVATGEPLFVAGAFTLEGRAAAFITAVHGDPHAVVGLSVAALRRLAGELDVDWVDLVSANAVVNAIAD